MKVKHLLFSGAFLAMGFAACTNEVEEFAVQTPDFEGVELSEDFTISVTNSDFAASAETRAILEKVEKNWVASWTEGDDLGAAWFSKVSLDAAGKVTGDPVNVYDKLGEYGSNAQFKWMGETTFKSEAVSKAGAYVLYYPYAEDLTDNFTKIPVKEINTPQDFNCADVDQQVSENIFAANVVEFEKGGNQMPKFTVKQIPNLYAINFFIDDEELLKLDKKVEISQVMIEVTNGGAGAINTKGTIAPKSFVITAEEFNTDVMPAIGFNGDPESRIERMVINVANAAKDSKYYITNLGKEKGTDRFYFSMLPVEDFDQVTFKIVGKVAGKTKVFARTYEETGINQYSAWTKLTDLMKGTGQVVELPVKLNYEASIQDGIYSVDQFVEYWTEGHTNFNLAVPMDLTKLTAAQQKKVNFNLPEATHITFEGQKVTLPSISGKYTFKNDVEIKGSAVVSGCDEDHSSDTDKKYIFCKSATIENDLTVTGPVTANIAKVNVGGNATLGNAKFTTYGNSVFEGDVVVEGDVEFNKATTIKGALTINEEATLTAKGHLYVTGDVTANGTITAGKNVTAANVTANAAVTVTGETAIDALEANAVVTMAKATVKGDIVANEAVTISGEATVGGSITANANVTFSEESKIGNIVANVPLTFTETIEAGDITANANINFATVTKAGNITVGTAEETVAITAKAITAADVNVVNGTISSDLTAVNVTVAKAGEVYAKNLNVTTKLTANGKVEGLAAGKQNIAELFVADGVTVDLNGTSTIENLTVNKEYSFFGKLNVANATIKNADNYGEVNGNVAVTGVFNQEKTITGNYTVAKDATLNVNANANLDILTNNGAVVVAEGVTLAAADGANNAVMTVNGTVDANVLVYGAESDIIVGAKGNLSNGTIEGTVTIVNGSKVGANVTAAEVIYSWEETNKPTSNLDMINTLKLTNATYDSKTFGKLTALTKIDVAGTWNLSGTINIPTAVVNVIADATFAATKATELTINTANVSKGVTLTVGEKVKLVDGKYYMASGSKFVGNKGTATIAY